MGSPFFRANRQSTRTYIQWTLEQHWFELCESTYMQTFSVVNTIVLHDLPLAESLDMELWIGRNRIYGGLTIKLYMDFRLQGGSAPLTPMLFKGQLDIHMYLQRCNSLFFEIKFYVEPSL